MMKKLKNNKGIGLVELLIVIAVAAMTAPLLFNVFIYGLHSYGSYNKYIDQHYKVMEVTQRIRKDVEEAAAFKVVYDATVDPITESVLALWLPDDDGDVGTYSVRIWKVSGGCLYFKGLSNETIENGINAAAEPAGYSEILGGLDTSTVAASPSNYMPTRFDYIDINKRILLSIKPVAQNTATSKNRNVAKPVITEFCVRYKDKITDGL